MRDELSVRPATLADAEAIGLVLQSSYPALLKDSYDAALLALALPLVTKANPDLLRSGTYHVCSPAGGPAIGCGGWSRERPSTKAREPGLGHIRHFATHPDWCGRGVGRALYNRCHDEAKASGIREFECHASFNAEGFYRALGFETLEQIEISLGLDLAFPVKLMRKSLA